MNTKIATKADINLIKIYGKTREKIPCFQNGFSIRFSTAIMP